VTGLFNDGLFSDGPSLTSLASVGTAHVIVGDLVDELTVTGPDGHHLARVRRLRTGEVVTAADGCGRWRRYAVQAAAGGELRLAATAPVEHEPGLRPRVAVAFCLTKGDKPEAVVTKLTELGVDRIAPVLSTRSVVRWDADRTEAAATRFSAAAKAAAEQSRRARLPDIEPVADLAAIAGHRAIVLGAVDGADDPAAIVTAEAGEVLAVVGPEGGLTPREIDDLGPRWRVSVAPTVLRAETAAVALAALLTAARWAVRGQR